MLFTNLSADALTSVLMHCTVKQLCTVKVTCRELCVAARSALKASRFAERKKWAALGEQFLNAAFTLGEMQEPLWETFAPGFTLQLEAFEARYWGHDAERAPINRVFPQSKTGESRG